MDKGTITLSRAELKKALVIDKLMHRQVTAKEAATVLGLSVRQVLRLKAKVREQGVEALAHGNRGRAPAHTIPHAVRQTVIQTYKEKYEGANYCHLSDLLAEHEHIPLSPSSVRRILQAAGIASVKQRRRPKPHRPRDRKPQAGMLWQTDASTHAWLEERGPAMALHGAIDDATGVVVAAVFRPTEDLIGYLTILDKGIRAYGVPLALYSDQHTIFFSPQDDLSVEQALAGETEALSQFGMALAELGVEHIRARSAQAKGRIERLWQTFQDRLLIELRIRHVGTLEEASAVLDELVAQHNKRFAVVPAESQSAYRSVPTDMPLAHILCRRATRTVTPAQTLSYRGQTYRVQASTAAAIPGRTVVQVRHTVQDDWVVYHAHTCFRLLPVVQAMRPQSQTEPPMEPKLRTPHKPAHDHPWRRYKKAASQAEGAGAGEGDAQHGR